MTNKFLQKQDKERANCNQCQTEHRITDLYRLSWRYSDKVRTYRSGHRIVHTGYKYLCKKCLAEITK